MRVAHDEIELGSNRARLGRPYFKVPGGIQYGNYNLDVVFANSIIKVPMEIMTEERADEFTKEWKRAKKEARHKGHEHYTGRSLNHAEGGLGMGAAVEMVFKASLLHWRSDGSA